MKRAITVISDDDDSDENGGSSQSKLDSLWSSIIPPTADYLRLRLLFSTNTNAKKHPMAPIDYVHFCTSQVHNYERYGILLVNSGFPVSLAGVITATKNEDKNCLYNAIYKATGGKLNRQCLPLTRTSHFLPFNFVVFILHTGDDTSGHWSVLVCPLHYANDADEIIRLMHFDSLAGSPNHALAESTANLLCEFEVIAPRNCRLVVERAPAPFQGIQGVDLTCGSWILWPLELLQQLSISNLASYNDLKTYAAAVPMISAEYPTTEYEDAIVLFDQLDEYLHPYFVWLAANQSLAYSEHLKVWSERFWPKFPRIRNGNQMQIIDAPPPNGLNVLPADTAWPIRTTTPTTTTTLFKPEQVLRALTTEQGIYDEDIIRMYIRAEFICRDGRRCVMSMDLNELVQLKARRLQESTGNFYVVWVYTAAVTSDIIHQIVLFVQPMVCSSPGNYHSGPLFVYSGYITELLDIVTTPPNRRTRVQNALIECLAKLDLRDSPFANRGFDGVVPIRTTAYDAQFNSLAISLELLRVACFEPEMLPVTPKAFDMFLHTTTTKKRSRACQSRHFHGIRRTLMMYLITDQTPCLFSAGTGIHSAHYESTEHTAGRITTPYCIRPLRATPLLPITEDRSNFSIAFHCDSRPPITCKNAVLEQLLFAEIPLRYITLLLVPGPGPIYRQLATQQFSISATQSAYAANTYSVLILGCTPNFFEALRQFVADKSAQPRPQRQMDTIKRHIINWTIRDMIHLFFLVFTQRCIFQGVSVN